MTTGRIPSVDGGIQPTIIDAAGDLIYGASNDTPARLAIGTAGQVLTVNSGATAPEWFTPAGSSITWTLLSTVALNTLSTTTVSGINHDKVLLWVDAARTSNATPDIRVRFNGSTTAADYDQVLVYLRTDGSTNLGYSYDGTLTAFDVNDGQSSTAGLGLWFEIENCKSSSFKPIKSLGVGDDSATARANITTMGKFNGTAAITSATLFVSSGTFTAGNLYVFGGS